MIFNYSSLIVIISRVIHLTPCINFNQYIWTYSFNKHLICKSKIVLWYLFRYFLRSFKIDKFGTIFKVYSCFLVFLLFRYFVSKPLIQKHEQREVLKSSLFYLSTSIFILFLFYFIHLYYLFIYLFLFLFWLAVFLADWYDTAEGFEEKSE